MFYFKQPYVALLKLIALWLGFLFECAAFIQTKNVIKFLHMLLYNASKESSSTLLLSHCLFDGKWKHKLCLNSTGGWKLLADLVSPQLNAAHPILSLSFGVKDI